MLHVKISLEYWIILSVYFKNIVVCNEPLPPYLHKTSNSASRSSFFKSKQIALGLMALCASTFLSVDAYFYMLSTNWLICFIKDIVDGSNLDRSQTRNFPPRLNFQWELGVTVHIYFLKK